MRSRLMQVGQQSISPVGGVLKAASFAAFKHRKQKRKDGEGENDPAFFTD